MSRTKDQLTDDMNYVRQMMYASGGAERERWSRILTRLGQLQAMSLEWHRKNDEANRRGEPPITWGGAGILDTPRID